MRCIAGLLLLQAAPGSAVQESEVRALSDGDFSSLYFDPGDGRLLMVFTDESREDAGRPAPRETGCVEHIAFNVSRATFKEVPARLRARGIDFLERDRGFMDSISWIRSI